jgi:hypothetical protein
LYSNLIYKRLKNNINKAIISNNAFLKWSIMQNIYLSSMQPTALQCCLYKNRYLVLGGTERELFGAGRRDERGSENASSLHGVHEFML